MVKERKTELVEGFRHSVPYINTHRGKTFVIMLGGEAIEHENFSSIVNDIGLLHSLGIRLVVVYGARPQIDANLAAHHHEPLYHKNIRVTDAKTLELVKQAAGTLQLDITARLSMSLNNTPLQGAHINVVSGNFIIAQPLGVDDGVDYCHSGRIRRIDEDACASEPGALQQTGSSAFLTNEVEEAFNLLGVPVREGREVAVDAIFDSVSVATTYREKLAEQGIIFCSFGEAIHEHPELVQKYLGTVVPGNDNFFAALNAAVASDGTFIYVPKGVRCPMELSTYFRINAEKTGQFERTILVADEGCYVSYIEGCSAPVRDSYQLHAAVVEVIIHKDAEVKYSTVQNWFPGDNNTGGILNFVTKRALCGSGRIPDFSIRWPYPRLVQSQYR